MGFDFSAVTALLGGYSANRKRREDPDDELDRNWHRNGRGLPGRNTHGQNAATHDPAGSEGLAAAPRFDDPPVTGGAPVAVSGIGRALDALMAAEETRRRKSAGTAEGPEANPPPLSAVLKASLPEIKAPQRKLLAAPVAAAPEGRLPAAACDSERNWDEIRELIEALGRAERPAEAAPEPLSSSDVRPWRPKKAS